MSGRARRWLLTGLATGVCAAVGGRLPWCGLELDHTSAVPVLAAAAAPTIAAAVPCESLRGSSIPAIEAVARTRIATIRERLVGDRPSSPFEQVVLELEGALLESVLAAGGLVGAVLDDDPARSPAGLEWADDGRIAATTYVLVHEGCAIAVRVLRADAVPVFEVWEALSAEAATSPADSGHPDAPPSVGPAQAGIDLVPAVVEIADRSPGDECWWEVVVSSGEARQVVPEAATNTDRVQAYRLLRGDDVRSWLVRGRILAPAPGCVREAVASLRTAPEGASACVRIRCSSTSALRPTAGSVACVRDQGGWWHGKLDLDWRGTAGLPQLSVACPGASGEPIAWELIQIEPRRFRLLLRGRGDGDGRPPAAGLSLQVVGEDVRHGITLR